MKNNGKFKKFIKFGLCAVILLATVLGTVFVGVHNHNEEVNAISVSKTVSGYGTMNITVTGSVSCNGATTIYVSQTNSGYPYIEVDVLVNGQYVLNTTYSVKNATYKSWTPYTVTGNVGSITSSTTTVEVRLSVARAWASGDSYSTSSSESWSVSHNSSGNTAATCTSGGRVYCTSCGYTHSTSGALGHSYGSWFASSDGYYHRTCSRCGADERGDIAQGTIHFESNTTDEVEAMPPDTIKYGGTNLTVPDYTPVRKGYDFLYWSASQDLGFQMGDGKLNSDGTYNGRAVDVNGTYIKRYWIKKIAGNSNTFEFLVQADSTNYVYIPTWISTQDGGSAQWFQLSKGSWTRNGSTYNFGGQFTISSFGNSIARSFMTHIYAQSGSGANNGTLQAISTGYYDMEVYPGETYTAEGNVTLYAHWKPSEYTITLDANGGTILESPYWSTDESGVTTKTVSYLDTYGVLPSTVAKSENIVKDVEFSEGYEIVDGQPTNTSTNAYKYATTVDMIPIEGGVTLTSSKAICGIYTYDKDGNFIERVSSYTTTHPISANACYMRIELAIVDTTLEAFSSDLVIKDVAVGPTLEREGYTFIGWYYDDAEITSDTVVDTTLDDHTLVAMWSRNYYNVTYHAVNGEFEDGSDEMTIPVLYGDYVDLSFIPVKDGRAFIGWSLDEEDISCVMSLQMSNYPIDLYAVYSIPVSDISHVTLRSYDSYGTTNEFEMIAIEQTLNGYYYWVEGVNLLDGLSYTDVTEIGVDIVVWDYAGNYTIVPVYLKGISGGAIIQPPSTPNLSRSFVIITKHYKWNVQTEDWEQFADTAVNVPEGSSYTPSYLPESDERYPYGFEKHSIEPADPFVVTDSVVIKAYYMPTPLKVLFDPNGGSCDTEYKELYPTSYYGELPTATWEGHNFLGWYTDPVDGTVVKDSDVFEGTEDTTLYAHWERRIHTVMYDYRTNGGNWVDEEYIDTYYGDPVNLDNQAYKDGWEFVGWNTDPNAEVGIDVLTMGDDDIVLYAIYKKEITVTYIDSNDDEIQTRTESITIYNTSQYAEFTVPTQNTMTGWECRGWSLSTDPKADIDFSSDSTIQLSESTTMYGCYVQDITLSYDLNGSPEVRDSVTKERYYNASDEYLNPKFAIASEPKLDGYSFDKWVEYDEDGNVVAAYEADEVVELTKDTLVTATWDKIPELEAYNRYFTLSEAQDGEITEERLLEKVIGTDLEDGVLENGTAVRVLGYQPEDFTSFISDGSVTVTYQATDSFGNTTTKTVTIYIVDTTSTDANKKDYIRFISSEFYLNEDGSYVSKENGGLEDRSLWTTDATYAEVLTNALTNSKYGTEESEVTVLSKTYKIEQPGSGDWKRGVMSYTFTKSQIEEVKSYVKTNGFAKYTNTSGITEFIDKFKDCITIW